jgi:uncharacterized membrane protein YbhN (UPF0104 family)
MRLATVHGAVSPIGDESRRARLVKVSLWLLLVAGIVLLLERLGVDVGGWLSGMWRSIDAIPVRYLILAIVVQTAQIALTSVAWLYILRAAYPETHIKFAPVLTGYAVGAALNGVLPASLGTFVMLYLFVAVIPNATYAGVLAGVFVQKLFFSVVGALVYVYLFFNVPGSASLELGNVTRHPYLTTLIAIVAVTAVFFGGRALWSKLRRQWQHAKQGGVILSTPRAYVIKVILPSAGAYAAKLAGTAIFLAAFTIPVTFDSVMHVIGGNSIAGGTAITPGGAGVNEAVSVVSLAHYVDAQTATAFAVGQHLVGTAWSLLFALILVPVVFGWRNGRSMLKTAAAEAKQRRAASHTSQTA